MRGSRGHEAARLAGTTRSRPAGQDATAAATVMAVNVKRGVAEDYTAGSRGDVERVATATSVACGGRFRRRSHATRAEASA